MLGYCNTPAGPRMLRPWDHLPCGVVAAAGRRSRLLGGDTDRWAHRTRRSRSGYRSVALWTRSSADPGLPRACLARPKSFIYHFAAEALLALI